MFLGGREEVNIIARDIMRKYCREIHVSQTFTQFQMDYGKIDMRKYFRSHAANAIAHEIVDLLAVEETLTPLGDKQFSTRCYMLRREHLMTILREMALAVINRTLDLGVKYLGVFWHFYGV